MLEIKEISDMSRKILKINEISDMSRKILEINETPDMLENHYLLVKTKCFGFQSISNKQYYFYTIFYNHNKTGIYVKIFRYDYH